MTSNFLDLDKYIKRKTLIIEKNLYSYFENKNTILWQAMNYSIRAGGKRLRPVIALAVCEMLEGNEEVVIPSACAIEMIHTQSLIHDDLPSIDNDDLRRGKPTNHKVYGEAMAIIAGDGLITLAFYTICKYTKNTEYINILKVIEELSYAAGPDGMCGGQAIDIIAEKNKEFIVDENILNYIHSNKTGAIIKASGKIGAILSNASENEIELITSYCKNIGLAFQIIDDILDVKGETRILGKTARKDINKATFPNFYGIEKSIKIAKELVENAISNLDYFGNKAKYLIDLAYYILERNY
ncbi:MAG: farnesyl-diphosphate synthase [Candidatus Sericytochromatia bacterium]|nr:MAG: farnesyl-diphosphate synthase [Candidatus Sericytochromatia bacterium]